MNGKKRWKSVATVTEAAPGETFKFHITSFGLDIADWGYAFESTPNGCRVTETWTDRRPGWFKPIARVGTGVADRQSHTEVGAATTLENLAAAAKAGSRT